MMVSENDRQTIKEDRFIQYGKAAIFAPLIIGGALVAGGVMMWQTHNRNLQMAEMSRIEENARYALRSAYAQMRALAPEEALASAKRAEDLIASLNAKLAPDYAPLKISLLLVEAESLFMKDCAAYAVLAEKKFDQALGLMNYASGGMWLFGMLGRARTRYEQGKYEEALQDLDSIMSRNPSFGAAYYWRALTREHLGDSNGASEDEKRARSLDSWPPLRDYMQASCSWTRDIMHKPQEKQGSASVESVDGADAFEKLGPFTFPESGEEEEE